VRILNPYDYLLDEEKPLLPQLQKIKRACFRPYISDMQLIKYECEVCSASGLYKSCQFYEAIHLSCFEKHLKEIQNNKSTKPPKRFHPQSERLCYGKKGHDLKTILKGTWAVFQHNIPQPMWVGTPEHRQWTKEHKKIQKTLPCESTCKMKEWCSFYNNGVNYQLCFTDIEGYNEDGLIYSPLVDKFDKGFRVGSYYYKNFIHPTTFKELAPIKTDGSKKKLEEWQYKIYELVFDKTKHEKKTKIETFKFILDILMNRQNGGGLLFTYLLGRSVSFDIKLMNEKWGNLRIYFEPHIKTLKELGLYGTLFQTTEMKHFRSLAQKHQYLLDNNSWKLVDVDITLLLEYIKQRHLELLDPFYEFYLSQERQPSRSDIEDRFKISQPNQISIEKRLGVRKDFRPSRSGSQLTNLYFTNRAIIENGFRIMTEEEQKNKLKKIITHNKINNSEGKINYEQRDSR
jgi:hypothetical protein